MKFREITYEQFKGEPKRSYVNCYTHGEDVLLQYREDEKVFLRIKKFPYYFCVKKEDRKQLEIHPLVLKLEDEINFTRVYVRTVNRRCADEKTQLLEDLKEKGIQTYEADLTSAQRLIADDEPEISEKYEVLYIDIETDDRGEGIVVGRDRILSIAAVTKEGKVYYYTGKDEREMLRKFLKRAQEFDLWTGWNSENFDFPYIESRLKYHDLFFNWKEIITVDLMRKVMELNKKNVDMIREVRSFSLNSISKYVLNEEKVKHKEGIYEMFEHNQELLKKYNIQDSMLLLKLDRKLNIIKQKAVEHKITGCFLNEYAVSRVLDIYVLRNAKRFGNIRLKTKPAHGTVDFEDRNADYVGGYVMEPIRGIHENIYHFDFTSLYPSIIQTFNISPETWLQSTSNKDAKYIHTCNDQQYSRQVGIIPSLLTDLLIARNNIRKIELKKYKEGTPEYEDLYYKQYSFKTIANSFYGVLGAKFTRYYSHENAEAITLSGHYLIKKAIEWFSENGLTPLYSDTDSVFAKADKKLDIDLIYAGVNSFLDYHLFKEFHITDSKIDLKIEDQYPNILFLDKKRYVKNVEGKLKIVGLEAKRRETLPIAAKAQIELLEKLLLKRSSLEEIKQFVLELREKVMHSLSLEDVTLQIKLSKDVNLYDKTVEKEGITSIKESKLAHVKVAKWLKENKIQEDERNTWEEGCYVKYVITEGFNGIDATSIYNYSNNYDKEYYWSVKVYAILKRVLQVVFPNEDWEYYDVDVKQLKKQRKYEKKNT